MCTFCQNSARNYGGAYGCQARSCGCQARSCGCCCYNNTASNGTNVNTGVSNSCCGCQYVTFPVTGTAYVPTSAIRFVPNCGWLGNLSGNTSTGSTSSGCNSCGFGRCGGAAAYANYNEDYYARQYGLNN
ncbi:MAG: hypothetical protein E7367_03915 [Clostridiales bacterium]|nr:hypothetical protein [Clostridiales bacterium]